MLGVLKSIALLFLVFIAVSFALKLFAGVLVLGIGLLAIGIKLAVVGGVLYLIYAAFRAVTT